MLIGIATPRFPNVETALDQLDVIYGGDATEIAEQTGFDKNLASNDVEKTTGNLFASTYGEILPTAVAGMLAAVHAQPGMRYYDLGSGFGKTVVLAGLLGLRATGVELSSQHYAEACKAWQRAKMLNKDVAPRAVNFIFGNMLEENWSDADVVFINSLVFSKDFMDEIAVAATRLRPGVKVISAKLLPGDSFELIDTMKFPTTWSLATEYHIQRRVA